MKKKMTALFAVAILLAGTTFATENGDPSLQIQNEFNRMFTRTTSVEWTPVSELYQVRFIQAGQHLTAYYNIAGELQSVSRNISTTMLPLLLQNKLQGMLGSSWISESMELSTNDGIAYYVTVETANDKTVYRSDSSDWSVYKRVQK